jgi:YggT family protein
MSLILYRTINIVFSVIELMILARVLLSWLPVDKSGSFFDLLYMITEPILGPIRRMLEKSPFGRNMMFDFSPIVAFLLLSLVRALILSLL